MYRRREMLILVVISHKPCANPSLLSYYNKHILVIITSLHRGIYSPNCRNGKDMEHNDI